MGIPNKQQAEHNSLQKFMSMMKTKDSSPAFSNLYSVHFTTPPILAQGNYLSSAEFDPQVDDMRTFLNYYADTVNLPSKQVTTGTFNQIGSAVRYATGSTFSQISIGFRMPRNGVTRSFFEHWVSLMANDASQYVDYFNNYVCSNLRIYKWERGGGERALSQENYRKALRDNGNKKFEVPRLYELTGCYDLRNVFPFNIGSMQLDNSQAKTMVLNVQFYYERYRFFKKEGKTGPITYVSPTNQDNVTTPETDPEVIRTFPASFPGLSSFYPDRGKGFGLDLMSGRTLEQSQFIG